MTNTVPRTPDIGPAIYTCAPCGTHDRTRYARCNMPDCPDGRDQYWWQPAPIEQTAEPRGSRLALGICIGLLLAALALAVFGIGKANAAKGFNPDTSPMAKWMESLLRPDLPYNPPGQIWPCCGKADAYPVSSYFINPDGSYSVVIADGSAITYPDGTTRPPIRTGRTVIVPASKVNKLEDDLDNPTDFSWVFLRMYVDSDPDGDYIMYCFARHPQGS